MSPAKVVLILLASTLGACTPMHGNLVGQSGNGLDTRYSLQDRRQAKLHVKITETLPAGASNAKDYVVERCDQYLQNQSPSNETLVDDLRLLAYAEGADGMTNIRFERESGLLKNCWSIARGRATFYQLQQR